MTNTGTPARRNLSHANCAHASTTAERTACRKSFRAAPEAWLEAGLVRVDRELDFTAPAPVAVRLPELV